MTDTEHAQRVRVLLDTLEDALEQSASLPPLDGFERAVIISADLANGSLGYGRWEGLEDDEDAIEIQFVRPHAQMTSAIWELRRRWDEQLRTEAIDVVEHLEQELRPVWNEIERVARERMQRGATPVYVVVSGELVIECRERNGTPRTEVTT